jgi:hypothetical protein
MQGCQGDFCNLRIAWYNGSKEFGAMSRSKQNQRGHKGQHWVAESYLKAWCRRTVATHEPFLWRYEVDGSNPKPKAPRNVFKASDLYTLKRRDGSRDLTWEQILGTLESDFISVRNNKLLKAEPLTPTDRGSILAFMAAQMVRTPRFRDHYAGQLDRVVKHGEHVEQVMKNATLEEKRAASRTLGGNGPSMTLGEVRAYRDHPLLLIAPKLMLTVMDVFKRMGLIIFYTNDDVGFITSDDPCVMFDSEWPKYPPWMRSPALMSPTIEVTMPLAPNCIAVVSHKHGMPEYLMIEPKGRIMRDEFNRRTRFSANKHFVVNQKVTDPIWFDPGKMPPDAWQPPDGQPINDDDEDDEGQQVA